MFGAYLHLPTGAPSSRARLEPAGTRVARAIASESCASSPACSGSPCAIAIYARVTSASQRNHPGTNVRFSSTHRRAPTTSPPTNASGIASELRTYMTRCGTVHRIEASAASLAAVQSSANTATRAEVPKMCVLVNPPMAGRQLQRRLRHFSRCRNIALRRHAHVHRPALPIRVNIRSFAGLCLFEQRREHITPFGDVPLGHQRHALPDATEPGHEAVTDRVRDVAALLGGQP